MSTKVTDITVDPRPLAQEPRDIIEWAHQMVEHVVFQLNNGVPKLSLIARTSVPDRPRTGQVVFADGVFWNPGFGVGLYVFYAGTWHSLEKPIIALTYSAGDETTAIGVATNKLRFRMPYAFTLTEVRASLSVAQASGAIFTIDVTQNGVSIFSTKPTIDNTKLTTVGATTPSVLSTISLLDDALMALNVSQVGAAGAAGLKVMLIGRRT